MYDIPEKLVSFSDALTALKNGARIARVCWNGKGMWLYLIKDYKIEFTGFGLINLFPWIGMKTADNLFGPWLASQTDILADDWRIIL